MPAEIKKKREKCPLFIERTKRGKVEFCEATGRPYCSEDIYDFTRCPHYRKYKLSIEENIPESATSARLPRLT